MGACIVAVALFIDLFESVTTWLGIGIVMSLVIAPCATLMFWIWYKILGVPFLASPKKFATIAVTSLVEIIPALDAIPLLSFGWTIGAIILVVMVRAEDKGGVIGNLSGAAMGLMQARYKTYKGQLDRMNQLKPKQVYALKQNMKISRGELIGAAIAKDKSPKTTEEGKAELYGRALDRTVNTLNLKNKADESENAV